MLFPNRFQSLLLIHGILFPFHHVCKSCDNCPIWGGSYIEKKDSRLAENEKYEITIRAGDSNTMSPDGEIAVDFWFEDTLGRRYKVKNAKENLKKLW